MMKNKLKMPIDWCKIMLSKQQRIHAQKKSRCIFRHYHSLSNADRNPSFILSSELNVPVQ